jgi:serine-type D-Ala-D-Ala carboxypeptidase/endopeptidase (penicillin-binding protein 4)
MPGVCARLFLFLCAGLAAGAAATAAQNLPPEARQALVRAGIPDSALAVVIHELGSGKRVLEWRADEPMNPASLMKLPTTLAALERLGPAFSWTTPIWLMGQLKDGVLEGDIVIQGRGDPQLVVERLWLALRQIRQLGVRELRGSFVLDTSAFALPDGDPGDFDGEALRPYNARPSALLLNYRSSIYTFVPDVAAGVARIASDTPLARTDIDRTVPLTSGPCGDWRAQLKASFEPRRVRFAGSYASACGVLNWPLADAEPASYDARLIEGLWAELGGSVTGGVREGRAPSSTPPTLELRSPPLAALVRDVNKFSNNVMAQQIFLSLALQAGRAPSTPEAARELLRGWLAERAGPLDAAGVVIDNGSGLSRRTRLSAALLARLLQHAADGPNAAELASSLPISGLDGTLRRSRATAGRAHLKTGSLRDVNGLAGYVLADSGRRYVLVAIVNHAQAAAARPALEALVQWALRDAAAR